MGSKAALEVVRLGAFGVRSLDQETRKYLGSARGGVAPLLSPPRYPRPIFAMIAAKLVPKLTAYHCAKCSLYVRGMTDLVQIPDHTLWLEYTCGKAVPVRVADAIEKKCRTINDVRRVARCAKCGARVKIGGYGIRLSWSLAKDRGGA